MYREMVKEGKRLNRANYLFCLVFNSELFYAAVMMGQDAVSVDMPPVCSFPLSSEIFLTYVSHLLRESLSQPYP